jgi:hypothetical protein
MWSVLESDDEKDCGKKSHAQNWLFTQMWDCDCQVCTRRHHNFGRALTGFAKADIENSVDLHDQFIAQTVRYIIIDCIRGLEKRLLQS